MTESEGCPHLGGMLLVKKQANPVKLMTRLSILCPCHSIIRFRSSLFSVYPPSITPLLRGRGCVCVCARRKPHVQFPDTTRHTQLTRYHDTLRDSVPSLVGSYPCVPSLRATRSRPCEQPEIPSLNQLLAFTGRWCREKGARGTSGSRTVGGRGPPASSSGGQSCRGKHRPRHGGVPWWLETLPLCGLVPPKLPDRA